MAARTTEEHSMLNERIADLEKEVDELTDIYNQTESSRVHHAQRGDTYKLLLTAALEMQASRNEGIEFAKEVNEWFEALEYKEETDHG